MIADPRAARTDNRVKSRISDTPGEIRRIALTGRFTKRGRSQYVVYASFGLSTPDNLKGHWRTVIFDTDLSIVATLGENEYSHTVPRSVGDVNGDGLDEFWADLVGYEGAKYFGL